MFDQLNVLHCGFLSGELVITVSACDGGVKEGEDLDRQAHTQHAHLHGKGSQTPEGGTVPVGGSWRDGCEACRNPEDLHPG